MRKCAFALIATLVVCGCGGPKSTPTPAVISFACQDYRQEYYANLAREFHQQNPDIIVELVSYEEATGNAPGVSTSDEAAKLAAAADTFYAFAPMVVDWTSSQETALALDDLVANDRSLDLHDFYSGALDLLRRHDKLWGLPYELNLNLLYYDPTAFDDAGVPHPRIGWTWEEFLDAAARTTIRNGDEVQRYGYVDRYPIYTLPSLAQQRAGSLLDSEKDPPEAQLDTPGVQEALQWYADLVQVYGVMPNPTSPDAEERQALATTLQDMVYLSPPAMWTGQTYELSSFRTRHGAEVVPLPEFGDPATGATAYAYFISSGSAHPEAAWRWIEYLTRQSPPGRGQSLPARRSVAEQSGYWDQLTAEAKAAIEYGVEHAVAIPAEIAGALSRAYTAVLSGASAPEALATAQAQVMTALAQEAAALQLPAAAPVPPAPEPTAAGTVIRFGVAAAGDVGVLEVLADRFHQRHPDITVEVRAAAAALPAAGYDCFLGDAASAQSADREALRSLQPFIEQSGFNLSDYVPFFLQQAQAQGETWGLPLETDALLLYYNQKLLDASAVEYPDSSWVPEQFIEESIVLNRPEEGIYGYYPHEGAYQSLLDHLTWMGARPISEDGQPALDRVPVVETLPVYARWMEEGMPELAQAYDNVFGLTQSSTGLSGPVVQGQVVFWTDSYLNYSRYSSSPTLEVGVTSIPTGAAPLGYPSVLSLFITVGSAHPEACWEWISFLAEEPQAVTLLPVRNSLAHNPEWRQSAGDQVAEAWLATLQAAQSWDLPAGGPVTPTEYWLREALRQVVEGRDPNEALGEAQIKAGAFTECLAGVGGDESTLTDCAARADPEVRLP